MCEAYKAPTQKRFEALKNFLSVACEAQSESHFKLEVILPRNFWRWTNAHEWFYCHANLKRTEIVTHLKKNLRRKCYFFVCVLKSRERFYNWVKQKIHCFLCKWDSPSCPFRVRRVFFSRAHFCVNVGRIFLLHCFQVGLVQMAKNGNWMHQNWHILSSIEWF